MIWAASGTARLKKSDPRKTGRNEAVGGAAMALLPIKPAAPTALKNKRREICFSMAPLNRT